MKKFLRIGALCLALMMATTLPAYAVGYDSEIFNFPYDGYNFNIWSTLYVDKTDSYRTAAWIQEMNNARFAAGYLKISSSLVSTTSGTLVSSGVWSNSANDQFAWCKTDTYKTSDSVYATGEFQVKVSATSSGYITGPVPDTAVYGGSKSASFIVGGGPAFIEAAYPTTSAGETYGSMALLNGSTPDLILAQGIDGTQGFVRAEDLELDSWVETPEDAALFMKLYEGVNLIPLYDLEGKVIGSYMITVGSGETYETVEEARAAMEAEEEEPAELLSDALLEKQAAAGDTAYFDQIKAAMAENAAKLMEKS